MLNRIFNRSRQDQSSESEIIQTIFGLVKNVLGEEGKNIKLTPDTVLEDIGFDSIKYVHLLLSLEDVMNASLEDIISEIDIAALRTINDIALLTEKFRKK